MRIEALKKQILAKKSFLCVGLDVDLEKVPEHIKAMEDPLYEFSKAIIDSIVAKDPPTKKEEAKFNSKNTIIEVYKKQNVIKKRWLIN